jgi:plastocyanin
MTASNLPVPAQGVNHDRWHCRVMRVTFLRLAGPGGRFVYQDNSPEEAFPMRKFGSMFAVAAVLLGACGGGEKGGEMAPAAEMPAAEAPAAEAPAAAPGGAAAVTGTVHEVKMIGDDKGYRFEPADLTIKVGDGVKFIMVSGGPHNVAFNAAEIPADAKAQLDANIPEKIGELSSAMKMNPNEEIMISFAGVPAGKYPYFCTPHLAMGMKGTITVQ